jgi:hypothetical protein
VGSLPSASTTYLPTYAVTDRLDISWSARTAVSANRIQWTCEGVFDLLKYIAVFKLRELWVEFKVDESAAAELNVQANFFYHLDPAVVEAIKESNFQDLALLNSLEDLSPFEFSVRPSGYRVELVLRHDARVHSARRGVATV